MFKLENVLGYLKNVLNYTHSELLDFCNVVPCECSGNTVILVTHEEEIAAYANRIIRLRDGLIESDTSK